MKSRYLRFFIVILSALTFFLPASNAALRELRVGVAVANNFKTKPSWKEDFLKRLGYSSRIFEQEFKVRFRATQFTDWHAPDDQPDSRALLDDLMTKFPLDNVDCVIGLSRLTQVPKDLSDLDVLGRTQPFSG